MCGFLHFLCRTDIQLALGGFATGLGAARALATISLHCFLLFSLRPELPALVLISHRDSLKYSQHTVWGYWVKWKTKVFKLGCWDWGTAKNTFGYPREGNSLQKHQFL